MQMRTPTGSRWMSNNYITWCHRRFGSVRVSQFDSVQFEAEFELQLQLESVWGQDASVRISLQIEGLRPSGPTVEQPSRMKKRCCYSQKNFGSICSSLFLSPTHLSYIANINPFASLSRIKCEKYIFLKKCVRSSLLLIIFPHVHQYG